nr:ribonuclease H-like domain, reverse transcriptase, RNA-dependent DNA polymerase [Tanacetum cinerariifolium]
LAQMGYEKPSTKLTFYKAFFSSQWKFLIHIIFQSLSAKRTSWNEFSTAMASAVICLSKGQRFNFSKYIFDSLEVVPKVVPPTPMSSSLPSPVIPSSPPYQPPCPPQPQDAEGLSLLFQHVLATCSALALRVEGLENDKAAQQLEIVKLKARVKKLEKINKGRMIVDMDHAEGIELVAAANTSIPAVKPKILTITAALAVSTRRTKGVVIRDPEEELPSEERSDRDGCRNTEGYKMDIFKGKKYDEILRIFQAKFDANMRFLFKSREEMEAEDEEIIKSINETHAQKAAKRRKLSEEAQKDEDLRKMLEIVQDKDDDVFVEVTPLAQNVPVADYQIVVIDNKPGYKIKRADDTHQLYISFTTLLKNFNREDLKALWRIARDKFSTSKPTNFLDEYLLLTLKTMFEEPDGQDGIRRNQKSVHGLALVKRWKLLTSCGIHVITLSTVQLFLLVERRYPLSRFTLEQLVNVARLQVEEESEMSLKLLRFTRQQL